MQERRAEVRYLCSDLIKVRCEGVDLVANLEDISPSGACLQFEKPVSAGARLELRLGRYRFRGQTKYCVRNEIGYFVGVQFDAGRNWSRELYEPLHLLDPGQFIARSGRVH